jgi:hypothetical protein
MPLLPMHSLIADYTIGLPTPATLLQNHITTSYSISLRPTHLCLSRDLSTSPQRLFFLPSTPFPRPCNYSLTMRLAYPPLDPFASGIFPRLLKVVPSKCFALLKYGPYFITYFIHIPQESFPLSFPYFAIYMLDIMFVNFML